MQNGMQNGTQNGNGILGANFWWHVPETFIPADKAMELAEKYGFADIFQRPSERALTVRAIYEFQDRRHKENRRLVEKASEDDRAVWGILEQDKPAKDEVSFNQTTTVVLDKKSGRVLASGNLREKILERVEFYRDKVTDDDIRVFIRRLVAAVKGVAKRPSGGIYFIPLTTMQIVENARNFLDEMGSDARLYVERVMDGEQERLNVWEAVENHIQGEIEFTLNAVQKLGKRAASAVNHAEKVKGLEDMMVMYRDILGKGMEAETMVEKIQEAANEIAAKMRELESANFGNIETQNEVPLGEVIVSVLDDTPVNAKQIVARMLANQVAAGDNLEQAVRKFIQMELRAENPRLRKAGWGKVVKN